MAVERSVALYGITISVYLRSLKYKVFRFGILFYYMRRNYVAIEELWEGLLKSTVVGNRVTLVVTLFIIKDMRSD